MTPQEMNNRQLVAAALNARAADLHQAMKDGCHTFRACSNPNPEPRSRLSRTVTTFTEFEEELCSRWGLGNGDIRDQICKNDMFVYTLAYKGQTVFCVNYYLGGM